MRISFLKKDPNEEGPSANKEEIPESDKGYGFKKRVWLTAVSGCV